MSDRLVGDLPVKDVESAAADIPADAALLVSGFGSVGYTKAVPTALANSERDLELTVVSGGSVGAEIDVDLVEANAIACRFPYQARLPAREAVNHGGIEFHDPISARSATKLNLATSLTRISPSLRHSPLVQTG